MSPNGAEELLRALNDRDGEATSTEVEITEPVRDESPLGCRSADGVMTTGCFRAVVGPLSTSAPDSTRGWSTAGFG